jgi:ABC-type glycerol-3-phosphate transport system substrate-binding protein
LRSNGEFQQKEVTQMKKLISLTLVLALATVFAAGCKKKTEEVIVPVQAPAAAPAPEQKPMSSAKTTTTTTTETPKAPEAPEKK